MCLSVCVVYKTDIYIYVCVYVCVYVYVYVYVCILYTQDRYIASLMSQRLVSTLLAHIHPSRLHPFTPFFYLKFV